MEHLKQQVIFVYVSTLRVLRHTHDGNTSKKHTKKRKLITLERSYIEIAQLCKNYYLVLPSIETKQRQIAYFLRKEMCKPLRWLNPSQRVKIKKKKYNAIKLVTFNTSWVNKL